MYILKSDLGIPITFILSINFKLCFYKMHNAYKELISVVGPTKAQSPFNAYFKRFDTDVTETKMDIEKKLNIICHKW